MTRPASSTRRRLPAAALLWAGLAIAAPAAAHDLTVEIVGAPTADGTLSAALYGPGPGWMNEEMRLQGQRVPGAQRATIVFRDLPAGRYAVAVFHDANGNGKLDTNLVGIPTEVYGFSRNARGTIRPPGFDEAALDVGADTSIAIRLR